MGFRLRDICLAGFSQRAPLALGVLLSAFVAACSDGPPLERTDAGNDEGGGAGGSASVDGASADRSDDNTGCAGPRVAQPGPATVAIDHSDCAARTPINCGPPGAPSDITGTALHDQLLTFAGSMCHLPPFTWVMVTFDAGCPVLVSVENPFGQPDANLVSCLAQQLGSIRWVCAEVTSCALVEWDLLP